MFFKKKLMAVVLLSACIQNHATSLPVNLLQPYDTLIKPRMHECSRFQISLFGERGIRSAQGYDTCGDRVNTLQIWNVCSSCERGLLPQSSMSCDQDALAMLCGFPEGSEIDNFKNMLDADDNGIRGHLCATGDLELNFAFALGAAVRFWDYFRFAAYLPIYSMELKNVRWVDKTQDITAADMRVKQDLTCPLFDVVRNLGCGLDLQGWKRTGIGDLALFVEGSKDFMQMRPFLKNVRVNGRVGLSLPTGLREDENKTFAIPFGYDGSVGIVWGGGLDLTFGCYVKTGFDVQLTHLFGNTRCRRIKTDIRQTELLLLQKVSSYIDWGLSQRFNLYVELYKLFGGFSFLTGYQFIRNGDDCIAFGNCTFSNEVANTARSLEESTMHQIILNASYDIADHLCDDAPVKPYVSIFSRIPVMGKNAALIPTVGAVISFDF